MIQPFAAPPGLVPRLDPPTAPREAAPEASFADLLGDPGREIEVLAVAADAIAASPNAPLGMASDGSGPEAAPLEEKAVAERFNEHGFFGRALPAFERAAETIAQIAGEPVELAAQAAAESSAPGDVDGAAPGTAVSRRGSLAKAAAMPAALLRSTHRGGTSGVVPQAATGQPASALAEGGGAEGAQTAPSSGRRLLGAAAERAAQSAARVALSETGHGLHVAAFAQALPEDERSRLRDEIAGLLSRHGLRPDRIHIAARRVPPASA